MSKYTQRECDRVVGWGKVPEEYKHESEKEELEEYVEKPKDNNLFEEESSGKVQLTNEGNI